MPLYEIMCITTTSATPQQLVHMLQRLAIVVQKGKGVFRRVEHLGVRPLAHRMKAHMKYNEAGRYVRLFLQASPVLCADVETRLRVDDHVVKTMTIKHKQAAPVVVEKRSNTKHVDSSSVTGVLQHAPVLEYDVAKALLSLGLLRSDDILALPRYAPDAGWEAMRQKELLKRAHGGSSAAARGLQVPIPTRAEDLAHMAKLAEKEEADMVAYEEYRLRDIDRRRQAKEAQVADEEAQLARRMEWYNNQSAQIRTRALIKKLGMSEKKAIELLERVGKDPRPDWLAKVKEKQEEGRLRNEDLRQILAAEQALQAQKDEAFLAGEESAVLEEDPTPVTLSEVFDAQVDVNNLLFDAGVKLEPETEEDRMVYEFVNAEREEEEARLKGEKKDVEEKEEQEEELTVSEQDMDEDELEAMRAKRPSKEELEAAAAAQLQAVVNGDLSSVDPATRADIEEAVEEALDAEEEERMELSTVARMAAMSEQDRLQLERLEEERFMLTSIVQDDSETADPVKQQKAAKRLAEMDAMEEARINAELKAEEAELMAQEQEAKQFVENLKRATDPDITPQDREDAAAHLQDIQAALRQIRGEQQGDE